MTTNPEEKADATEDRKGATGDMPGYILTGEYRRIKEVYRDWVHPNDGVHLSRGIANDEEWKTRRITLAVMNVRHHDVLIRRVGRCFMYALAAERTGFRQRL